MLFMSVRQVAVLNGETRLKEDLTDMLMFSKAYLEYAQQGTSMFRHHREKSPPGEISLVLHARIGSPRA